MTMTEPIQGTLEVQVAQRGLITLPQRLRAAYDLRPGDRLSIIDLGGVFVLSPHRSQIDALADRLASAWREQGVTMEGMLQALREERARYDV